MVVRGPRSSGCTASAASIPATRWSPPSSKISRDRAARAGLHDLAEIDEIGNIHELALDYDDLLDHLKLDSAILVGHSFGAMVAAEIAAHFPRRAKKLVLLAPVGIWNEPIRSPTSSPSLSPWSSPPWHDNDAREALAARRSNEPGRKSKPSASSPLPKALLRSPSSTWPIPEKGLKKRLPRIVAPSLAIFGEDGFESPRYAEDFAAKLPKLETVVVKNAGHMLPYEKTAEVVRMIEKFLAP